MTGGGSTSSLTLLNSEWGALHTCPSGGQAAGHVGLDRVLGQRKDIREN